MSLILIAAVGLALLIWAGRAWFAKGPTKQDSLGALIPAEVSLQAQPLLTEVESSFYNLLRLAVQEHYLVFAQVPLWCLFDVKGTSREARAAFMRSIALKRVDFVLVHPGTLTAAKVVELDDTSQPSGPRQARQQLIDTALHAAGIECVRLQAPLPSTVPALASLLGIESDE